MDVYCPNMTIFDPSPNEERMAATIANMRQPSAESLGQHLDLLSWLMRHGCPPQGLEKSFSRYLTWNCQSIYPSIYLSINLSISIYRHLNVCVYNCIYIYMSTTCLPQNQSQPYPSDRNMATWPVSAANDISAAICCSAIAHTRKRC